MHAHNASPVSTNVITMCAQTRTFNGTAVMSELPVKVERPVWTNGNEPLPKICWVQGKDVKSKLWNGARYKFTCRVGKIDLQHHLP
jgi:hypothetical protein